MGNIIFFYTKEDKPMLNILDVAQFFLSLESMNHKKLQKLCYYAQAWYLALKGVPFMNTWFEAWVHGPVSPELYTRYRSWGGLMIPQNSYRGNMVEEQKDFLRKIYSLYGNYSGNELERLTHLEMPWQKARKGYSSDAICTETISNDDMGSFYREYLH